MQNCKSTMTYKLTNSATILRTADSAYIPADPANTDYAQYLQWLADGNTPEPADPVLPVIPQSVTRFQAKAALSLAGYLPSVEAIMAHPDTPFLAKLAWAESLNFERNSPTIAALAAQLKLTDTQVDELFVTASGISA